MNSLRHRLTVSNGVGRCSRMLFFSFFLYDFVDIFIKFREKMKVEEVKFQNKRKMEVVEVIMILIMGVQRPSWGGNLPLQGCNKKGSRKTRLPFRTMPHFKADEKGATICRTPGGKKQFMPVLQRAASSDNSPLSAVRL